MQLMHPPSPARQPAAAGFTLVELLVALLVMALLSLMSWRGLDAMARAQTQTQARADDLQALRNGLGQWTADLDAMATELSNTTRAINALPSQMEWNGQVFRITRYSGTAAAPGLRVVTWRVGTEKDQKTWLRWQSPLVHTRAELQQAWTLAANWAQTPTEASRALQVSIVPVVDWQIFYFRGDTWSNPGSSSESANINPEGVRLVLTLPEGQALAGKLSTDWMRSTVAGRR
ncbi:MAG: prepilin-type N-terminal cleavage/methylation domain-containing protein [Rhodoferax sp.]|nr:prepilin-type N-terminal cleavage/methylation domain-containing protein [Rhodoferax sp.]